MRLLCVYITSPMLLFPKRQMIAELGNYFLRISSDHFQELLFKQTEGRVLGFVAACPAEEISQEISISIGVGKGTLRLVYKGWLIRTGQEVAIKLIDTTLKVEETDNETANLKKCLKEKERLIKS
ncbi:hypothetical protein XENTR_v10017240 [Xenopus tropicalis]|nr:hypothetical protein XENTR_v10017240 [Xenopus tropicalis]